MEENQCAVHVIFSGPGSANVSLVSPEGNVTPFQLLVASIYLKMLAERALEDMISAQRQVQEMIARK